MRQNVLSSFVNNTACELFLHKLVCGTLAEFLQNLAELFRFVVDNPLDINGKRIEMMSMLKKHLLLIRSLGINLSDVVCWKWGEILYNCMEEFRFVGQSFMVPQLLVKDNLWWYKQLLGPYYWKTLLNSPLKNLSSKVNFIKFSKNCQFDVTSQRSTVIV